MANTINLNAEVGANFIGDDAQPSVTFANSSTGPGLSVGRLHVSSGASVDILTTGSILNTANATILSNATEGVPLSLSRGTVVSSPTVALIRLGIGSGASAPVFELAEQSFVSCTTIQFTTVAVAGTGAIRVKYGNNYGWIPVMNETAVTAAPRG